MSVLCSCVVRYSLRHAGVGLGERDSLSTRTQHGDIYPGFTFEIWVVNYALPVDTHNDMIRGVLLFSRRKPMKILLNFCEAHQKETLCHKEKVLIASNYHNDQANPCLCRKWYRSGERCLNSDSLISFANQAVGAQMTIIFAFPGGCDSMEHTTCSMVTRHWITTPSNLIIWKATADEMQSVWDSVPDVFFLMTDITKWTY